MEDVRDKEAEIITNLLQRGFNTKYIIAKYMKSKYPDLKTNEYRVNSFFKHNPDLVNPTYPDGELAEFQPTQEVMETVNDLVNNGVCHFDNIRNILGVVHKVTVTKDRLLELGIISKVVKEDKPKLTEDEQKFIRKLHGLGLTVLKYLALMASNKFDRKINSNMVKHDLPELFEKPAEPADSAEPEDKKAEQADSIDAAEFD